MEKGRKNSVLKPGDRVGEYTIVEVKKSGGMANAYLVKSIDGQYWFAKEVKKSDTGKQNTEFNSFINEVNILSKLRHNNIPRIVKPYDNDDSIMVIMDYIEGINLAEWSRKNKKDDNPNADYGRFTDKTICNILLSVAMILGYLHKAGNANGGRGPILYRDLKPQNIMLGRSDGNISLIDFGISVELQNPRQCVTPMGTRGYAAPEQQAKLSQGIPVDLRSDIYALGMLGIFLYTGRDCSSLVPTKDGYDKYGNYKKVSVKTTVMLSEYGKEVKASLANISGLSLGGLSPGLQAIIKKCTALDPANRYQSIEEVIVALQNEIQGDTAEKRSKHRKKITTSIILLLSGFIIGLLGLIPLNIDRGQSDSQYQVLMLEAEQSNDVNKFIEPLNMKPAELYGYDGILNAIKTDGQFTKEEESILLNIVNPNLPEIKKNLNYGSFAYELGKLYWFYYEDPDQGKLQSIRWFSDAIDNNYNVEEASVYYNIGIFNRDILKFVQEASDSGLYRQYWDNLMSIKGYATSDILSLQTNTSIIDCISNYAYNLKKDGVAYEELSSEINRIEVFLNNYDMDTIQLDSIKTLYTNLKNEIDVIRSKVDVIYEK